MSLFGALYLGNSGLHSSQNALNTVAHNLSNVNTPGYVRQQVSQSDTTYTTSSVSVSGKNNQIGDGVKYSECRHVRDMFLDETYREETGRQNFYDVSYSAILEIEDIMGELGSPAFKDSVNNLWSAMQELSKDPSDTTNISLLVQKSAIFMENATSVYNSFKEYQDNLNSQVKAAIKDINEIGQKIAQLNEQITRIEAGGVEHANDLRDSRDALLDKLATYGNISYKEETNSMVEVKFNGADFVTGKTAYKMEVLADDNTGYVTPYWKHYVTKKEGPDGEKVPDYSSAYVFDVTEDISSAADTDIGRLRALLLARGDHVANYTDLTTDMATKVKLDTLGISADSYNEAAGLKYYDDYISNSIIMNVEAEFDNIVHGIITKVNDVLAQACNPESGYLCNADGSPMQIFEKITGKPYDRVFLKDDEVEKAKAEGAKLYQVYEDGKPVPGNYWKYNEETAEDTFSLYNSANTQINQKVLQTPALLGFRREEDSTDFNMGEALVAAFEDAQLYLNPNATQKSTYFNAYTDLASQVCNSGNVFKELYEFEQLSLEQVENERQTVIGVSSDEELEHMIMYQNAYNAASRYINTINSMLDALMSMAS